jgi:hypothetical protein
MIGILETFRLLCNARQGSLQKEFNMLSNSDLNELKRMATNLYDDEKARINRIIKAIADLNKENAELKAENIRLRAQVSG